LICPSNLRKNLSHQKANCFTTSIRLARPAQHRCPAGAITEKGHDKDKCFEYSYSVIGKTKKAEFGVTIAGCGLCQTKVPCEFEIPKLIQKERGYRKAS